MSEAPLIGPSETDASITATVSHLALRKHAGIGWFAGVVFTFSLVLLLFYGIAYLFIRGVGIWGVNIPVAWGFAITNFVWWIGIGHAGTLISAILLLLHQKWRNSINRFAEAMTIFAVMCAGMMPLLHLGRPWMFYYIFPYPDTMNMWPQFRSPLVWDFFAVSTYLTVSIIFWYIGMIPDLATLRDRAPKGISKYVYGVMAFGWRGDAEHWERYEKTYLVLAGLATPLVVSVHSVVSFDFAVAQLPGWHSTIFPPYFVAGAIFSGFAMVLTIAIPLRAVFGLQALVTERHLENCAKLMLTTGLIVDYGYLNEFFLAWYGNNLYEKFHEFATATGAYWFAFWIVILCNVGVTQLLWFKPMRIKPLPLFIISILVNVGMWTERFVIVVTSLSKDWLPSSWGMFFPTVWDWVIFIGSLGLFTFLYFVFLRLFPIVPMAETRKLVHGESE
ncbi:MAG TPA: NrfD/PsrC family molybdoenzyme membrane anchor subunit [Thermoanaerobaculia bacterium]|jgi:Ni/Fe-hydrogenase subunit HybB-like protein|nr:NrfD/PsrC family molybdoenzyme membrane anchor subunit [Thermoanaerobaculia bacterium]